MSFASGIIAATLSPNEHNNTTTVAIFEFCFQCLLNLIAIMPAVPQGAFAACKVREQRHMKVAKLQSAGGGCSDQDQEKMAYFGKYLELPQLKYNSKLMNSIWGLYNRYSVHNFKKNTDAAAAANGLANAGSQQLSGYPANTSPNTTTKSKPSTTVLVTEWINIWGSHKH